MTLETWAAFCLTEAVLCFTPGPAVLLVVSVALGRGGRAGIAASLGILAANVLYFALSATGVAAALLASRELFLVLRWAGAAYLVWLGLRMVFAAERRAEARPAVVARPFARGVVVQGANPKNLMFFTALLPQFIDPAGSAAAQLLVLGISSVVIESVALAIYALGSARAARAASRRLVAVLERVGGGLLVAAGARLAAARSE